MSTTLSPEPATRKLPTEQMLITGSGMATGLDLIVKRAREIDGEVWLMSDRPDVDDFRVPEVQIVGRVTSVCTFLPE